MLGCWPYGDARRVRGDATGVNDVLEARASAQGWGTLDVIRPFKARFKWKQ